MLDELGVNDASWIVEGRNFGSDVQLGIQLVSYSDNDKTWPVSPFSETAPDIVLTDAMVYMRSKGHCMRAVITLAHVGG